MMTLLDYYEALEALDMPHIERELVLPTGTLIVAPDGIVAELRPPFSKLSRHYPWQFIPASFAALRVLMQPESCETIGMVERFLGLNEVKRGDRDPDRFALEETDLWCSDVERIVRWGVGLAEVCPSKSVAHDLMRLPSLQPQELDRYVMSWMPR